MRSGVVRRWAEGEPPGGKRERVELRAVGKDGRVGGTGFARRSRFEGAWRFFFAFAGCASEGWLALAQRDFCGPTGGAAALRCGPSCARRSPTGDWQRGIASARRCSGAGESVRTKTRVFSGFRRRYPVIAPSTQSATRGFLEHARQEAKNTRVFVHDPFNKGFSDARRGRWQAARKLAERLPSLLAPASAVSTSFCALRSSVMRPRGGSCGCRRRCSRVESSLGHQQRRGHVEGVVAGGNATA